MTASPVAARIGFAAWYTLAILTIAAVLSYIDRQLMSLMIVPIQRDLGLSDVQIGLVQGLGFGLFYALFGLPIGWLVDRRSRRGIIYAGMTFWSIATALCGLARSFGQLLVARFAVGVGEAALYPAAFSIIADIFPPRRLAMAVGILASGAAGGAVIAYVGGGALIAHLEAIGPQTLPLLGLLQPWQIVFLLIGLPGCLVALLLLTISDPPRGARVSSTARQIGLLLFLRRHPRYFACHFLGFGMMAILSYGVAAWMPTMLMRRYDMGVADVGLFLGGTVTLFGLVGYVLSGWIADRWYSSGRRDAHLRYFVVTNILGAVLAPVVLLTQSWLAMALPIFFLLHFLQPAQGPAVAQLQLVTPPHLRGQVAALFVMVFNLMGLCIGPVAVGYMTDHLFRDPMKIHYSITLLYVIATLGAALLFSFGLAPARAALDDAERG